MNAFMVIQELIDLHDALIKSPSDSHKNLILYEFKNHANPSSSFWSVGHGRRIWPRRGDGFTTCMHCGRKLTNAVSRIRGVGPICFNRFGGISGRPSNPAEIYKLYVRACSISGVIPLTFIEWTSDLV